MTTLNLNNKPAVLPEIYSHTWVISCKNPHENRKEKKEKKKKRKAPPPSYLTASLEWKTPPSPEVSEVRQKPKEQTFLKKFS